MSSTGLAALARRPPTGVPAPGRSSRIGVLAGGGRLPLTIAESVVERGGAVHIVGIEGEADAAIARFPHTWVNWGQVGRMVATLRGEGGGRMVIAGSVRRPDLWKVRPDWGFFASLPQIPAMLKGGDDSVLSRVVRFFEAKGLEVLGAHEVAPDLLAQRGRLGERALDVRSRRDAELGSAVRAVLGPLDAGQAVVVADGRVLAIEGAEGTDAMLRRVAEMRGARSDGPRGGVLAKGPKPGQELRVDMPAIGPRTVELAGAAGLAGVALEAGAVLLLDRSEAVAEADALGLAIEGLPVAQGPGPSVPSPLVGEGQGGGESSSGGQTPRHQHRVEASAAEARGLPPSGVPPTPNPSPHSGGAPPARRGGEPGRRKWEARPDHPLRIVGRLRPSARAGADVEKGLAAVDCLAPFGAGEAVVVARAYLLAIAAAESTLAVIERARALRQWGVGARRRVGVLVCRAGASPWGAGQVATLLERAAAAGLSGVAVTGRPEALAAFAGAGGLADRHGLFLLSREESP